jgi:hypothetical protein
MSQPFQPEEHVPAVLISASQQPPVIAQGTVHCLPGGECRMDLENPEPRLAPGDSVVLDCRGERDFRLLGRLKRVDGPHLHVAVTRRLEHDRRAFPRLYGGVRLRYAVAPASLRAEGLGRWAAAPEQAEWHAPDPFMEFSGSGLRFEDRARCAEGDYLLVEWQVPPFDRTWRSLTQVVRVEPIPEEERPWEAGPDTPTHRVAVHFLDLPSPAVQALLQFTERLQEVALPIPPFR